jgi:hypothetical protein
MNRKATDSIVTVIGIDIGKNSTWLGWTSAGRSCCVRSCHEARSQFAWLTCRRA